MADTTLLWHDYETWGVNPRVDRAAQFAAIRTTPELEIIGEPISFYCKPASDFIPHPQSVLITGISPQKADAEGLAEAEFFARIHAAFSQPGTCGVGYNTIRFDDEVTRFGFYRNFTDPYAREWQNGNSRWDIVDLVRMTYALRPEGIEWPEREPGVPSFRLDQLAPANGIGHDQAHDALSDVHATIALARLIREKQPKLYDYYFEFRKKQAANQLVNLRRKDLFLHISGMYPSTQGCISPVMPVSQHPRNKNEIIVFDLRQNPEKLLTKSADQIRETLFTPKAELPEGTERVALKGVHINKSPAIAPIMTLSGKQAKRWDIDLNQIRQHHQKILKAGQALEKKIQEIYSNTSQDFPIQDADSALYNGFIDNQDRKICEQILKLPVAERLTFSPAFQDDRLQTLYPRYLGRNWPDQLNDTQLADWKTFCQSRIQDGTAGNAFTLEQYFLAMDEAEQAAENDAQREALAALAEWVETRLNFEA